MNHMELITDRCFAVVERTIMILETAGVDYVLGGGWAVYTHAPSIPSIDTDIFLHEPLPDSVQGSLEKQGLKVGHGKEVEPLSTTEHFGFWAHGDEDLGIPEPGFRPAELLEGHVEPATLKLPSLSLTVPVPKAAALCCLKLCALANRDLAYRSFHDGRAGMHIGPQRMPMIHSLSQSYYLRKASKDLFDVSLLMPLATPDAVMALATRHDFDEVLHTIAADLDPAVQANAKRLAQHAGAPEPQELVAKALGT